MVRNNREEWKTYDNVFDNFTNRLLFKLASQGHFDEIETIVAPGKEANVFIARKGDDHVIVKIYRLNCNFNTMHEYIRQDPRYVGMPKSRRKTIFSWVQREYRNLLKAREFIRVPTPIAFKDHVLVMELIGNEVSVSPTLKNSPPKNPEDFFDKLLIDVHALWHGGLVHGDLSEFNILNHNESPIIIDFSQSTTTNAHDARKYLERDLENLCRFFTKRGLVVSYSKTLERVLTKQ